MMKNLADKYATDMNKDRWLISYADFITLLFAFFVVMYSISTVNQGKYRILSETLDEVFRKPITSLETIDLGDVVSYIAGIDTDESDEPINKTVNNPDDINDFSQELPLDLLIKEVKDKFKGLIKDGKLQLREEQNWLEIQISSNLLFRTGGSFLTLEADELIAELGKVLKTFINPITVEGFSDNVPIENEIYPSNWELSADRAARVVRAFIEEGVHPTRLAAVGYGSNFPVASNKTVEGRKQNRRVVLLIEKNNARRSFLDENSLYEDFSQRLPGSETTVFELQEEIVIEPKPRQGNDLKPIIMPDGSIKYNANSIYDKSKSEGE